MTSPFDKYLDAVSETEPIKRTGVVSRVQGLLIESRGPQASVGELCRINLKDNTESIIAEVIGLNGSTVQLMAYEDIQGVEIGCDVIASGMMLSVPVGSVLLGRVVDSLGRAADGKQEPYAPLHYPILASPPDPLERRPIKERIVTGIRAIDALLAVGRGQRIGIFAGSGIGKSTLMGMIARNTSADVNVIALIGERGREVNDFLEHDLGPEGLKHSVVVTATSDTTPLARIRGAYTATAIAEYFRDQGKDVMLLFDSVTRLPRLNAKSASRSGNRRQPAATLQVSLKHCLNCLSGAEHPQKVRLPAFIPYSLTATTWTSRFPMRYAVFWTGTLYLTENLHSAGTTLPSTYSAVFPVWQTAFQGNAVKKQHSICVN